MASIVPYQCEHESDDKTLEELFITPEPPSQGQLEHDVSLRYNSQFEV